MNSSVFFAMRCFLVLLLMLNLGACTSPHSKDGEQEGNVVQDGRNIQQLLDRGLKAADKESFEEADAVFKEMMLLEPRSARVLNLYAIYLRERWQFEQAESVYLRALSFSPDDIMTHWNIALLYELYLGQFDKAIKHYRAYQELTPDIDKRVDIWVAELKRRQSQASGE